MNSLTIIKPDDWHTHLRQEKALQTTVPHTAQQFARAVVMPNLTPPIINTEQAIAYRQEIIKFVPQNCSFDPLMTLYLTDNTDSEAIKQATLSPHIIGCKLYPAGATTNSDKGVSNIKKIYHILETMEKHNLPLLIHGEVTDHEIDIFDREMVFIDEILVNIRDSFPELKLILEHITTKHAVQFVMEYQDAKKTAATITPHHLFLNRNDLLVGGIKPHYYCLPILKDKNNQEALINAALSGKPCFFAGSDSAPHVKMAKESDCGCAGVYHGPFTILFYAQFFDQNKQLDKLEAFLSFYGADFYGLPRNTETIILKKTAHTIPTEYSYLNSTIIPFWSGKNLDWGFEN